MHGVPADLPLQRFVGHECQRIDIGQFQIQFSFDDAAGMISVEGGWELRDASGHVIDRSQDHAERDAYRIHRIIDVPVVRFTLDPPRSFTLHFEDGHALTIFDDSNLYESFSILPDGIFI